MRWIWLATMFLHTGCLWVGAALVANEGDKPTDALRSWPIGQPSPPAKDADIVRSSAAELEAYGYVMAALLAALAPYARPDMPTMQVVVEDDPVLVDLLVAAGARVHLEFLHFRGALADAG